MSFTAETFGPVPAMEELATRKNLPTNMRLRSKNMVDKLRSGKQLNYTLKIPTRQMQCNTLNCSLMVLKRSYCDSSHHSWLVTFWSPCRSLKARLVNAFWCAVYSLIISPVLRLQSRATLSELAESKYCESAVKSRSQTHLWASHPSSMTREKSWVRHTLILASAEEVTK